MMEIDGHYLIKNFSKNTSKLLKFNYSVDGNFQQATNNYYFCLKS